MTARVGVFGLLDAMALGVACPVAFHTTPWPLVVVAFFNVILAVNLLREAGS